MINKSALPGCIAFGLLVGFTTLWTFWGIAELFHEGWHYSLAGKFFQYLLPGLVCLAFTLLAITWPRAGGGLLIVAGLAFSTWWLITTLQRVAFSPAMLVSWFFFGGTLVVAGLLLLLEHRHRQQGRAAGPPLPRPWLRRHAWYVAAVGLPLLVGVATAIPNALVVADRLDDGQRGERLIEGNGVRLVWAPLGPGWATDHGPSWNEIALYGVPPVGLAGKRFGQDGRCHKDTDLGCPTQADLQATNLCRYLSADGLTLLDEPQDIWRLPTTAELVGSLVRDGQNAGCVWDGKPGNARCRLQPDKETPLWIPSAEVIYYWSSEAADAGHAYYVSYNGVVATLSKFASMDYRGFRCVREP